MISIFKFGYCWLRIISFPIIYRALQRQSFLKSVISVNLTEFDGWMCVSLMHCVPTLCILSDNAANGRIRHMLHSIAKNLCHLVQQRTCWPMKVASKKDCQSIIPLTGFVFISETRLLWFELLQTSMNSYIFKVYHGILWTFKNSLDLSSNLSQKVWKRNLKVHILGHKPSWWIWHKLVLEWWLIDQLSHPPTCVHVHL